MSLRYNINIIEVIKDHLEPLRKLTSQQFIKLKLKILKLYRNRSFRRIVSSHYP